MIIDIREFAAEDARVYMKLSGWLTNNCCRPMAARSRCLAGLMKAIWPFKWSGEQPLRLDYGH